MHNSDEEYDAILIDTSVYDANGLRLEKGVLGKLSQFKRSPIDLLIPDVIKNEIKSHLEQKIKVARNALEKSLNDAGDHLFFDGSSLNDAKKLLIDSAEIENLASLRLENFISITGALILSCGEYVSVSTIIEKYFANHPPFAESGKKKNEFPDAIVLFAAEEWARRNDKKILAVARDDDWKKYCDNSERLDYLEDLAEGLALFHKSTAPYALLTNIEKAIAENTADDFIEQVASKLHDALDGFTPDQDAESYLHWEPEGSHGQFKSFEFSNGEFRIIDADADEGTVVLEARTTITVEVEGDFSLSAYDSVDKDYVSLGGVTAHQEVEFTSEILITVTGNLDGPVEELTVEEVELDNPIDTVHFGSLELDYGGDDHEEED